MICSHEFFSKAYLLTHVRVPVKEACVRRAAFIVSAAVRHDEAEPSPARRYNLRVLGNPDRLHPHRPVRLDRALEPPGARRGQGQAAGACAQGLHRPPLRHTSSSPVSTTPPPSPPRAPHPFQIWDKVYGSGRHFIGVGKRFHTFPMDYRLVDFSWMTMADSYGDTFYDAPSLVGRTPQAPSPPPAPATPHAQATRHKPHATHVKRRTPHG